MFKGVHYVTMDYTVYVQDGWINFAYWKPQFVSAGASKEPSKTLKTENAEQATSTGAAPTAAATASSAPGTATSEQY